MNAAAVSDLEHRPRGVGKKRPRLSADFLAAHIHEVSGLILREACKHLPEAERSGIMERYRRRSSRARPV